MHITIYCVSKYTDENSSIKELDESYEILNLNDVKQEILEMEFNIELAQIIFVNTENNSNQRRSKIYLQITKDDIDICKDFYTYNNIFIMDKFYKDLLMHLNLNQQKIYLVECYPFEFDVNQFEIIKDNIENKIKTLNLELSELEINLNNNLIVNKIIDIWKEIDIIELKCIEISRNIKDNNIIKLIKNKTEEDHNMEEILSINEKTLKNLKIFIINMYFKLYKNPILQKLLEKAVEMQDSSLSFEKIIYDPKIKILNCYIYLYITNFLCESLNKYINNLKIKIKEWMFIRKQINNLNSNFKNYSVVDRLETVYDNLLLLKNECNLKLHQKQIEQKKITK